MDITHEVSVAAGHAIVGLRAGADKLASRKLVDGVAPAIDVRSVAFEPNSPLPISCTVDGVGAAPPIGFHGVPENARSLVLLCEDPDAPLLEPFVHWLVYGIPGDVEGIDAQSQHAYRMGNNSRSEPVYTPAAPPPGHGVHNYHFQVFALDREVDSPPGADRKDLIQAMTGHVIAWGEIVGTYERD